MYPNRYLALGDSFTEGVGDPDPARPNGVRGWADWVAEQLILADPDWGYANLAVRGKKMAQIAAEQVDAAARDVITAAGWGEYCIHRTGPGIGLDTHEAPYIVAGNDLPLEPGMAFSVEPGIYLPGCCGARIEDIVVCTDDGVTALNEGPRELVVLPG